LGLPSSAAMPRFGSSRSPSSPRATPSSRTSGHRQDAAGPGVRPALTLETNRVQGTPDLLPSDITGSSIFEAGSLRFAPGPVFTNVLLVDEINRATPRTQAALLEAMQERQVTVEGVTRQLPDPFVVLATQNPIEFEGTFSLPQAQLDRFLVRGQIGYPDATGEGRIARRYQDGADPLDGIVPVIDAAEIRALRDRARTALVTEDVEAYIVAIVRATGTTRTGSERAAAAVGSIARPGCRGRSGGSEGSSARRSSHVGLDVLDSRGRSSPVAEGADLGRVDNGTIPSSGSAPSW